MPSTTVLSYQWTCPGGYCDAGAVDSEWAARIQQGNILVVNVRRANADNGAYTCTVMDNTQQVGAATYTLSVASEYAVALSGKREKAISISKLAIVMVFLPLITRKLDIYTHIHICGAYWSKGIS